MQPNDEQTISQIIDWQWKGYDQFHASKVNLLLHIVFVPVFLWGTIGLLSAVLRFHFFGIIAALILMATAFLLQGLGHQTEAIKSIPFASPSNALKRILIEQWITFPKFVISGGWWKAFNASQ
jgi:hypothetical protein